MPNTKMTRERMKNHFQYGKNIYIVIIILMIVLADVLFTTTVYQAPSDRRIDIYLVSHNSDITDAAPYEQIALEAGQAFERERDAANGIDVNSEKYKTQLEEVNFVSLIYDLYSEDGAYSQERFMMTISTHEGDIYMVSRDVMEYFIQEGLATDLTGYIESGIIDPGERNLLKVTYPEFVEKGQPATGNMCIYGLPIDTLSGLWDAFDFNYSLDMYMVMMSYSENQDTSAVVMQSMIDQFEVPAQTAEQ
jgi:hypothetical protein